MISTRSRDHGRPAAKHRLYERKRQPFAARNQDMDMMVSPYLHELPFITTNPHSISQAKVPYHVLYVSSIRSAAEEIESPIPALPLRAGECFKHAVLALTPYVIPADCSKSHLL